MPTATVRATLLADMFAALDRGDVPGYLTFLAENASLRFGNNAPVVGKLAIKESLDAFYKCFNWVSHDHVATWTARDGAAVEANVSYEKPDGSTVHVPAVTICRFGADQKITDYRIFVDLAPLFAA
jgi:ketosteroid isomerase-like protein